MLIKFSVKNYRGFKDRISWDLSHPGNYSFNTNVVKRGALKNGIVYGPNGCGKTALSMALFDIVNHLTQKFKKADYYNNFVYAGNPSSPVEFEYVFRFGETELVYDYSKDATGRLLSEGMYVAGVTAFERKEGRLSISEEFPIDATVSSNLNSSANAVSIVNYLLSVIPLPADHYLMSLKNFVDGMLWFRCLKANEFIGLETSPTMLDEYIISHDLVADFTDFLDEVSGQRFDFSTSKKGEKVLFCRFGKQRVPFSQIASTGTDSLRLLYYWSKKIGSASFIFIDEFDAFYHFKLSFEVCKRLFNLDCQVFLSSHNTYLMTNDLLRPDSNFIMCGSEIKPLCDCTEKELRFGHNIEKMFRAGEFKV